jgi:NhaA family Na+:H+ antiporter
VVLGLIAPVRRHREDQREPLAERVERGLHPWTSLAVVPTFAVANSGVRLSGLRLDAPGAKSVAIGTAVALAGGKALGILVGSWVALRTGLGARPEGLMWRDLAGAAACGGVGFTVSLFIAGPAFDDGVLTDAAKLGVLGGSAVAAVLAAAILLPGRKNPVNGSGPAPPPARSG